MKPSHRSALLLAASFGFAALTATAEPLSFDFKDPKGVNNVQFSLDAPLESITGTGTGISGQVQFDPANPGATTGRIVLSTSSLTVGNPMMTDHLRGEQWLNASKNPEIVFEATELSNVKTQGATTTADARGKLTLNGVTKEITVPVTITYLPGKLGARINKPDVKGDLLVLRGNFEINRGDYNLQPGKNTDKVAETISLSLSIAGSTPRA